MGGTCVIRGCVPKKLLVYASRFASDYEDSIGFGWSYSGKKFDWHTLIENKNKETSRLEAAYTDTIERAGVTRFATRAVFEATNKLRLVGLDKTISAGKILIATGATPVFWPDDSRHRIRDFFKRSFGFAASSQERARLWRRLYRP